MYFTSLPDHSLPGFDKNLHFSKFGRNNIVFNALATKAYEEKLIGCLSIKRVLQGEEWYRVEGRDLALRPGRFLMLNDHQDYTCRVDTAGEVRVQSFFFKQSLTQAFFRDRIHHEEALLDDPWDNDVTTPVFYQTLYPMQQAISTTMDRLISGLAEESRDTAWMQEQLGDLLVLMADTQEKEQGTMQKVAALRPALKEEIYRRLCIARDHLHSNFAAELDLETLSRAACMSVPQLVRQFKAAWSLTPHQCLIRIRLEHAAALVKENKTPIRTISWQCGFRDVSAFCRAFKKRYGVSPGSW